MPCMRRSPMLLRRLLCTLVLASLAAGGTLVAQPPRSERLPGPGTRAATARSAERSSLEQLRQDISVIIGDANFADATWGISVVSCDRGEQLFNANDRQNRQVASNIKL